jgi:hypothetical protein
VNGPELSGRLDGQDLQEWTFEVTGNPDIESAARLRGYAEVGRSVAPLWMRILRFNGRGHTPFERVVSTHAEFN